MEVLTVKIGEAIPNGFDPPTYVVADYRDGAVTVLRVNGQEEDVDDLLRQASNIRRQNKQASRNRLDSGGGVG